MYWQRKLAPLGIGHWRIEVDLEDDLGEGEDDTGARVDIAHHYDTVEFVVRRDELKNRTEVEKDELIVHELLHVADRDLDVAVRDVVERLGLGEKEATQARLHAASESRVERLARLIVALHS